MDRFVMKKQRKRSALNGNEEVDDSVPVKVPRQSNYCPIWRKITRENLDCDYTVLLPRMEADALMTECEKTFEYNEGKLAEVFVFGKWHKIPRKQVAFGEQGLTYSFSNNTVPAKPWPAFMTTLKQKISKITGYEFNFVLINRYKDGNDHMGEHRDDEDDLVDGHPIASLSLGQARDFIFRHADSRGKQATRKIEPVKILLEHGSLLMMNHPTNTYWYHSLPPRKKVDNVRINMTFRLMKTNKGTHKNNVDGSKDTKNDVSSKQSETADSTVVTGK